MRLTIGRPLLRRNSPIQSSSNFCNNHPALSINPFLLHFGFERAKKCNNNLIY